MKNIILISAAVLFTFLMGCQENQLNQPDTDSILKDNLPQKESIKICCEVNDPNYGLCNLNGCVDYIHKVIEGTMGPMSRKQVSLKLYMNSILCDKMGMVHLDWKVEGRSDEVVYVSEEGILLVEKTYFITNRSDAVLLVQYLVTTDGVGISKVNLIPVENSISITNKDYKEY